MLCLLHLHPKLSLEAVVEIWLLLLVQILGLAQLSRK